MYAVNVDFTSQSAVVHAEACRHYLRRAETASKHGYWRGGFSTRDEALAFARSTGMVRVQQAWRCCARL
jgi:hypothetical protein